MVVLGRSTLSTGGGGGGAGGVGAGAWTTLLAGLVELVFNFLQRSEIQLYCRCSWTEWSCVTGADSIR